MAVTDDGSKLPATFAKVAAIVSWAAIIPLFNVMLPLAFQLWNEYSLIAFFGEVPSHEEIRAQHWKLDAARAISVVGSVLILTAIGLLARMKMVRRNLFVALGLSIALCILWFAVNR